ncbi:hypothetical protein PM082_018497 [Marasmius tenuissimus]|nr:hypothetical protein PM082_018497 [Marasmius tenuissimus]
MAKAPPSPPSSKHPQPVPARGVITTPADANSGGVAGFAIFTLLLVWGYKTWRRRRDLEGFNGNFVSQALQSAEVSSPLTHCSTSDTTHSYNTHSPPPSATFAGAIGDWRRPSPGPSLRAATATSSS